MKQGWLIPVTLILLTASPVFAKKPMRAPGQQRQERRVERTRRMISAAEAISIAQGRSVGKVLSTELVRRGEGSAFYRIKLISNGRVEVVTVDAYSGS